MSGRAAHAQLVAQRAIARHLHRAYPDELDEVGAAALVGGVVGAVSGALTVVFQESHADDGERLQRRIHETTTRVLRPWLAGRR